MKELTDWSYSITSHSKLYCNKNLQHLEVEKKNHFFLLLKLDFLVLKIYVHIDHDESSTEYTVIGTLYPKNLSDQKCEYG